VHHDTHDVICLQVAGEKRWLVYEPVWELPLRDQRYRPELGSPGATMLDVVLRPGDTLYLPRGWLHEALTSETDSLHLTIGVNVYPWLEALRAAVEECADDVAFRRAVPADGRSDDDLLAALAERLRPEDVARRMRERFLATRRPIRDSELTQRRALDGLSELTELERRETVLADVRATADGVVLAFEGKEIVFPHFVRDEVEFLVHADGAFSPADLPGELDREGRLVLVRRLVREGFLRVAG
jgi:ribosomal protein L16 Arg81 hydroxylase